MKVLYIGILKDGSGWSHAANDSILAMDRAGIEVVPRSISFKTEFSLHDEMPARVKELMENDETNCDICIQHLPPSIMSYNGNFKNIAYFESETSHFKGSGWNHYLNTMDEVWVPNKQMVDACIVSGVDKIPKVIPHACDTSKYSKYYDKLRHADFEGKFMFYTITDFNRRKNLAALLKAFHTEFHPTEPVGLFIKSSGYFMNNAKCKHKLNSLIKTVKDGLKLYPDTTDYIKENIVVDRLSENEIMRIHFSFDCFVSASCGEAWNIPAFDAMGMGKTPICSNYGGTADFLLDSDPPGFLVDGQMTPVFTDPEEATSFGLYRGDEYWFDIDIPSLRKAMRKRFNMTKEEALPIINNGIDKAYNFSYSVIGSLIKDRLLNVS